MLTDTKLKRVYDKGRRACLNGKSPDHCPHPSNIGKGIERQVWFDGWYDQWRWAKWGANEDEIIPLLNC